MGLGYEPPGSFGDPLNADARGERGRRRPGSSRRESAGLAALSLVACAGDGGSSAVDAVPRSVEAASSVYGTVTYLGDIPSNKQTDWLDHAQGVAVASLQGRVQLFFTTNTELFGREVEGSSLFGVSKRLPARRWQAGIPVVGYDHFGDLDHFRRRDGGGGVLFVPLEVRDKSRTPLLVTFDVVDGTQLRARSHAPLASNPGNEAPWVSVLDSEPDYIATSTFNPSEILLYHALGSVEELVFDAVEAVPLFSDGLEPMALVGVQGGEFNRDGRLFLLAQAGPRGAGVYAYVFDEARLEGRRALRLFDHYPTTLTPGRSEELEGITLGEIDLMHTNEPSHVHALLVQDGDIFFKHWRVSRNTAHFGL